MATHLVGKRVDVHPAPKCRITVPYAIVVPIEAELFIKFLAVEPVLGRRDVGSIHDVVVPFMFKSKWVVVVLLSDRDVNP